MSAVGSMFSPTAPVTFALKQPTKKSGSIGPPNWQAWAAVPGKQEKATLILGSMLSREENPPWTTKVRSEHTEWHWLDNGGPKLFQGGKGGAVGHPRECYAAY